MKGQGDSKIDWFRVITELCVSHGYTHTTIAAAVDSPKSTVQGWKQGAEPRYSDGDRLLLLWSAVTGKVRDAAPMVGRYDWR